MRAIAGRRRLEAASTVAAVNVRREVLGGAAAGGVAGLVTVAAMYLVSPLAGMKTLPDLLQNRVLAIMPGVVFGFLIDRLQHAGKVLEEAGLVVTLVIGFAVLGAVYGWLGRRRPLRFLAMAVAGAGWLLVVLVVLALGGSGLHGLGEGVTTPLLCELLS